MAYAHLVWYGSYYGYNQISDAGQLVLAKYNPTLLANLFLCQQDFLTKNLGMGIGVYNVLNFEFIQPDNGGHAPLPDKSWEFMVNFNYKF